MRSSKTIPEKSANKQMVANKLQQRYVRWHNKRKSSLDHSNPLLICELAVTAQKKDAEVTANRPLKLLADYALATKDMLGTTKKATLNKLKQYEKSTYHTTYNALRTDKLNLASLMSCIWAPASHGGHS